MKSAQQMVITAQDFKEAGIDVPILVGGAALSRRFTETKIADEYGGPVIYAKDAMQGLEQANLLMGEGTREKFLAEIEESRQKRLEADEKRAARPAKEVTIKPARTVKGAPVFLPADLRRHVKKTILYRIYILMLICVLYWDTI